MKTRYGFSLILLGWLSALAPLQAGPIKVAVAANFAPTLNIISRHFTAETGHEVAISVASTGTIYAQIINGAPYEVFLAADRERPGKLEKKGLTETRFTYAIGRLALWAPGSTRTVDETWLQQWRGRLAIANPRLAPYGAAAAEVIERLGAQPGRLIKGSNVAQAFGFIQSGNAPAGFVALAQLTQLEEGRSGDYWLVPAAYHSPIEQQAVVLKGARDRASEFATFLRSSTVRGIIEADGYDLARP